MESIEIPSDMTAAFAGSILGAKLTEVFPIGQLHRGTIHVLHAWQEKFHPIVKRRRPKKRKRK